jgi:long-chain acyl-CoA synthetase
MLFPIYPLIAEPDKTAFEMCGSGECVSFAQLDVRANQVAHVLRTIGVRPGAHVAILMENNRRFLEACFGMDRAGVYYTTVNTRLTCDEIAYIVNDCGAEVLVASNYLKDVTHKVKPLISKNVHCFSVGGSVDGMKEWESFVDNAPSYPIDDPFQGLDMLYSSGTTGRPKGVKWPMDPSPAGQPTMLVNLLGPLFDYGPHSRYLSPAPLYHAAPLRHSMTVIKLGGSVYVMESFDAQKSLSIIEKYRITHSQWVPTMFVRLLKLDSKERLRYDVSSLQVAVHAAAPCPIDVKEQMLDWWGPILREYYAGTENNGFCSITSSEWLQHKGSVGRASQGLLHICDEEGKELDVGQIGLVYFSEGPNFSYHNDPVRTQETRNNQGWTTLGDIGKVDAEGYLYLLDRRAFMIISGGVNIYPQEVENVLINHPKVMDVAVIGVPDEEFGEAVKAVVQPINDGDICDSLKEELISYCKQHLAFFKCPRSIDFDFELPRHPTGKLYKKLIRDRYWP